MYVLNLPEPCTVSGLGLGLMGAPLNLSEKDVGAVWTDVPGGGEVMVIGKVRTDEEDVNVNN